MLVALAGAASGCSPSGVCAGPDGSDDPADAGGDYDGSFNVPPGPATTIPLAGCAGPGYAANFVVGSETLQLTIDTGSGTLAVASNSCPNCGVTPVYTPGPSATDTRMTATDSYLQGSWQGEIYSDSVQLLGTGAVTMNFAAIGSQTGFFTSSGCGLGAVPFAPQGIVGFGPTDLAKPNTDAFVTKLAQAGAASGLFAFEFCSLGGKLMFGGVDPIAAALTGPAAYTPITTSDYYGVALDDLQLGGASLGFDATDFGMTAVDTGTSVLALPSAIFDALTSQIEGAPAFATAFAGQTGWLGTTTCLSSSLTTEALDAQLPPLTLVFPSTTSGMTTITLKATQSYLPPTQSNETTFYCSGVIANQGTTGTILGTSVMHGQLVIFDLQADQIGFAPQAFCP
jgi:hypothetical protein